MTSPVVCTCGTVHVGDCVGTMTLCVSPGYVWDATVALCNRLTKTLQDWPDGTAARVRFSWGTGTELIIAGTVDGPYLRFHMDPDESEQLPRGTSATIDVNYDDGDPDLWRPWRHTDRVCS